jgi:hypothetical protein
MAIRKRASTASLSILKEDAMLRAILQAGLQRAERDIKDASDFGDVSDKVQLLYDRRDYITKRLAEEGKLSLVAN